MNVAWTLVITSIFCYGAVSASECSTRNTSAANLATCLTDIRAQMVNSSAFWFGSSYTSRCPNGPADGIECSNQNHGNGKNESIGRRLFPDANPITLVTGVDRYLDVTYTSEPGEYTGCNNKVVFNTSLTISIDPSQPEVHEPWHLRHLPDITWNYTAGEYYTLVVYDVGYFVTHAVYINIEANNLDTATAVRPYFGPLISYKVSNPYMFMIFKQAVHLTLTSEWRDNIRADNYTVPDLEAAANLTGPIAVSWVVASGDVYAAQTMLTRGLLAMCPVFVSEEMNKKTRPFLPNTVSLSVDVNVQFSPAILTYDICCKTHTYMSRDFSINPIGNEMYSSAETRSDRPTMAPTISFLKKGLYNTASDFTTSKYSLIVIDPDVPYATAGTEERPLLHMMAVNILNGNMTTADIVQTYRGPTPPDSKPHYYYFLLYEQQTTVNATEMTSYAGNCSGGLLGRCLFNINLAVSDNSLTLVGASWMLATTDDYVLYRQVQGGQNGATVCQGQLGYADPCPVDGATELTVSWFMLTIMITMLTSLV